MGNCSSALHKVLKCYHENRRYYCKTCDRILCLRCKERHLEDLNTQSHIVVCKNCPNEEKEYFCNTCECSLCVQCKELHIKDLETKYHEVIREKVMCRHEEKGFYCTTCKDALCVLCKERHDQDMDTKNHGIIIKLTNCTHMAKKYYCNTCQSGLCVRCKERHVVDLDTKSHEVVIEQESIDKEKTCEIHPDIVCDMWCLSCKRPVCFCCLKQRKHEIMKLEYAFKTFRQEHKDRVVCIRSDVLPYNRALLAKMYSNVQTEIITQRTKISNFHADMINRSGKLKDQIGMACIIKMEKLLELKHDLIFKLQQRQREIMRHISTIERYENKYEQSANRPVQFLLYLKKTTVPRIKDISDTFTVSLGGTINMNDAMNLLEIQIRKTRKRQLVKEDMLEKMSTPLLQNSIHVPSVYRIRHISIMTSDRFCVSDGEDLVMTDTTGHVLHNLRGISSYGGHCDQ